MRGTSEKCRLPTIRIWQTTPLTAPHQRLVHTNPTTAACAISKAQDYHPNVWSNSSSRIGSAVTPKLCNNRSCPASALRFAVWSNSSSGIASNSASGAAGSCPIFISSSVERAGAIAGALVGSPTCFAYVQHPIILTLNKLALQCVSFAIEFGLLDAVNLDTIMHV